MEDPLVIDTVQPVLVEMLSEYDILEIEWFEIRKHFFTKETIGGRMLRCTLVSDKTWKNGQALLYQGTIIAVLRIKECLTIQFRPQTISETADFCYYVGNRHLPIYTNSDQSMLMVPYDGKLFEQLEHRYPNTIILENHQLLSEYDIREIQKNKKNEIV